MSVRALASNARSALPAAGSVDVADSLARSLVPREVHAMLRSPGEALDRSTRDFMQTGFGHDFSRVRVHTDAQAAKSAHELRARAFTVGRDVIFARGAFAPNSHDGRRLIAHELTHVVQNEAWGASSLRQIGAPDDASEREARAASQRILNGDRAHVATKPAGVVQRDEVGTAIGIGSAAAAVGLGLGIAALAGAFDSDTFTDQELQDYLTKLENDRKIEGERNSDNKARAVVARWSAGAAGFTVLIVPIRILLINEMASGYLSDGDQDGILDLLRESIPSERAHILPAIKIDQLKTRFDGDRRKSLDALLESQDFEVLSLSDEWSVAETKRIVSRHGDGGIIKKILSLGFKIFRFETAFDTWKYFVDGRIEENEVTGLMGNTDREVTPKRIRLRKSLNNEKAASTLFHEGDHAISAPATTHDQYLEGEVHARVEGELFGYRHGMPPVQPGYRTAEGRPDEAAIRRDVTGSSHYNPQDREWQNRRYVGEAQTSGWEP